jgi:hypothetical protein
MNLANWAAYALTIFLAAVASRQVSADELEQGIRYTCSSSLVEIESIWKDGGGAENPFAESDTEKAALWNIDRLQRPLPIIKICQLGKHKITTVISKLCGSGNGEIAPSAAMYVDDQVSVNKGHVVAIGRDGLLANGNAHPFVEARVFGSDCGPSSEEAFSKIVVRVAKSGEKEAATDDTPLVVEMK